MHTDEGDAQQTQANGDHEHHTHEHDPRIRMGDVPQEVLRAIRRRSMLQSGWSRRDAVRLMGMAALAGAAGCGSGGTVGTAASSSASTSSSSGTTTGTSTTTSSASSTTCSQGLSRTEGPYWVDGSEATPLRSDIRPDTVATSVQNGYLGVPLSLSFAVYNYAASGCSPMQNARVDVWHCDAQGGYSEEAQQAGGTTDYSDDNFLRGYQLSDANGLVSFVTIVPGWYSGRTAHIHLRIRTYDASGNAAINSTTQVFFDESMLSTVYASTYYKRSSARDTFNTTDSIYHAKLLMTTSGSVENGYSNTLFGIGLPF